MAVHAGSYSEAGTDYLLYSSDITGNGVDIRYATASSPAGPWQFIKRDGPVSRAAMPPSERSVSDFFLLRGYFREQCHSAAMQKFLCKRSLCL
jgi:hypothetical protein